MSNIHTIHLSTYETPVVKESKQNDWVEFGESNDYFNFLAERYRNSTTNSAIINSVSRLIYGRGISALDANRRPNEYAAMISMFAPEDLRKVCTDRKLFGQAAFQVLYKGGKVVKAHHIPVNLLRPEKCNEDGEITGYYYSDNWEDTKKFPPKRFDAFGYGTSEIKILYIMPYEVGMKYFAFPDYSGAIPYATLEEEISQYLINEVQNGFSPTMIVNFNNGVPTEEQQNLITNKVTGKLSGSKGKKIVTAFNSSKETATSIEAVPLNDAPEHYSYLSEECVRKIMLGHGVTSPLIFGIATTTGFSANADELKNSVVLFDNMVIRPFQDEIIEAMDKILAENEISLKLFFKTLQPLEFTDLENTTNKEQVVEETGTELSAEIELDTDGLISLGEDEEMEGWVLVDSRDVDYDLEDELDEQLKNWKPKKTLFQKLASTVKAIPNARSEQDKIVNDIQWKVRYQYTGNPNPQRGFCKQMMSAKKIYRKEDLERVNSNSVNAGFGHNGEPYNVFLYAGGPRCKHYFKRLTFASIEGSGIDVTSPNAKRVQTGIAAKRGYKITNPYQVSVPKNNLPHKGFHPNNKNMPSDAK